MNRDISANDAPDLDNIRDEQFLGVDNLNRTLDHVSVSLEHVHAASPRKFSPGPQSVETCASALISNAMNDLSQKQREKAFNEVHGVDELPEVTREFIEGKITELQQQLRLQARQQSDPRSQPFALAEMQNPDFAYHPVSCERFLRASNYDVSKAAADVLRHYHWKMQLWGESKLGKEIEMDDLSQADIGVLKKGYFQVLPERDRAGRMICSTILSDQSRPSAACVARALWYTFQLRLDQPSELMAVMLVFHRVDPSSTRLDYSLLHRTEQEISACRVFSTFPMKKGACHHCVADDSLPQFQAFMSQLLHGMDSENKAKTRVHCGSFTDWMLSLRSYGIPSHLSPINDEGRIRVKHHLEFLQGRRTTEQLVRAGVPDIIFLPLHSDILFGRGKPIHQTAGNLRLTAIVDSYVMEYNQLRNKQEKTALASKIVQMVKQASGRFLSRYSGVWTEVTDEIAREKVSGLLRTLYRKRNDGEDAGKHRRDLIDSPMDLD